MKILVCLSRVPDTTTKINFTADQTALDKQNIQWILNPVDESVLTKAIQLQKEAQATVTVINVGLLESDPILRKALAIGANDAVRINIEPMDSYFAAQEIAYYAKEGDYDLVITGIESIDYNGRAVPGMVAQLLDRPFIGYCLGLEVKESEVKAVREIDGGKETISENLPLVVACEKDIVEDKDIIIPNMRSIMTARSKVLKVADPTTSEAEVKAVSFEKMPSSGGAKLISPDNLDELIKLLHEEAKVI